MRKKFKDNTPGSWSEGKTESRMTLDKNKEVVSKFSVEFFEKANTAVTNDFKILMYTSMR